LILAGFAVLAVSAVSQQAGFRGSDSSGVDGAVGGRRLLSSGGCTGNYASWIENGGWVAHALGILYMFLGIAIVCDDYFVASLEAISEKMGLSEDVAGATFMAAGSSAPELFSSTMSLVSPNATNDIGISTIVGSAVFNILIIIAATALCSEGELKLDWKPVTRDCTFYAAAIVGIIFIFEDGKVWWHEGLVSTVLYFVYVLFMHFNEGIMAWVDKMTKGSKVAAESEENGKAENGDAGENGAEGGTFEGEEKKEEEEDKNPFALPESALEYPMWILSLPWYAAFWLTIPDCSKEERSGWFLATFFMCVLYISGISYFMVDWGATIGCVIGIPEVVMGSLVLAAGTSVPDALGSIGVAKAGMGDMAVANAVGSNVFDIWLGLGLPWLVFLPLKEDGYIEVSTKQLWPSILILFGVLVVYYGTVALSGWKLTRTAAYIFLVMYAGFALYLIVAVWLMDIYDLKDKGKSPPPPPLPPPPVGA